jgi:DNA-binding NarL/FixJ family response regulator
MNLRYCPLSHVSREDQCTRLTQHGMVRSGLHCPQCRALTKRVGDLESMAPRLLDVLVAVHSGASNKRIAFTLGIGARTVNVLVSRMLAATGCSNRTEAALLWERALASTKVSAPKRRLAVVA